LNNRRRKHFGCGIIPMLLCESTPILSQ